MNTLAAEQQLAGQFLLVWQRLKWWLLVAAAAGALGFSYVIQHKAALGSASVHYSLSEQRVSLLAADYQALAPQSQLFIGALEVDELARLVLQLDSPQLWSSLLMSKAWCEAQPKSCASSADQVAALSTQLKSQVQFEQKRRGNLLFLRWKSQDPAVAARAIELLVTTLTELDRSDRLSRLTQRQQTLQLAIDKAASVGERSTLAAQLDQVTAQQNLWQQGYYQPFKQVGDIVQSPAKKPAVWFAAVIGAVAGLLMLLTAGLLMLRQ